MSPIYFIHIFDYPETHPRIGVVTDLGNEYVFYENHASSKLLKKPNFKLGIVPTEDKFVIENSLEISFDKKFVMLDIPKCSKGINGKRQRKIKISTIVSLKRKFYEWSLWICRSNHQLTIAITKI